MNSELRIIRILNVLINPAKSFTVDNVFLMNYVEVELLFVPKYSFFPSFYDSCRRSRFILERGFQCHVQLMSRIYHSKSISTNLMSCVADL